MWISPDLATQRTVSPASTVTSPGRKRMPWMALLEFCEPTWTVQVCGGAMARAALRAVSGPTTAASAATAAMIPLKYLMPMV